jgi:hypothetical protein
MHAEYVTLRGRDYRPPANERLYVGTIPDAALPHVEQSARRALELRPPTASS